MTQSEAIKRLEWLVLSLTLTGSVVIGGDDAVCLVLAASALREQDHFREDKKMVEWIPVEKRLPETPEKVLVYAKSGNFSTARYIKRSDRFITAGQMTVTHWMPLPKPPAAEGGLQDG